ncbi:MAG: ABC transporter permease [Chloroflexi bacterium]|nr:ABC transporter permease [Chloroflexota bacterium]
MRLFYELVKLSFRLQFTYRTSNLAGLVTNFFFGLLRAAVLIALYGARTEVAGLSLTEAITFTGLSQATIAYLSFFGWWDVMHSVYNGDIGSDLLKPMGYFVFWLGRDLGRAIANLLLRSLTIIVAYALVFDIVLPHGVRDWLALGAALVFSMLLSFTCRFLINLAAFWTPDARGVGRLAYSISWFLSGFLMPLDFFPDWFVKLCNLTPFPSMVNTVIQVYLSKMTDLELFRVLGQQLLWVIVLFVASQLVLRAGVRRLVIQGG